MAQSVEFFPETEDRQTIELIAETATIEKRRVTTGTVSIRTVTEAFAESVSADLSGTTVAVEHVAVDRFVDTVPQTRVEGDVTIVPVFEEVLVVERRIRLVEELHIRHVVTNQSVRLPVTVRRQRAVVERLPAGSDLPVPPSNAATPTIPTNEE